MTALQELYQARVAAGALQSDPAQQAALAEFARIEAALSAAGRKRLFRKAPSAPKGLYLWGGVGRGKSMLMDLFVESLCHSTVRRVHFHAFMQEIHASLHVARKRGVTDAIAPVAANAAEGVQLLAFDEMQITDITDAMIVGRLFERLFAAGVVVVATSNRPPDDLYRDGLNRALFLPFIALIKVSMVVHEIAAPRDYRQDRPTAQKVYFSPLGAAARAFMDARWADLAGGPGAPLTLDVTGRSVELARYRNGIGRSSFLELCARPLGAADYLAITRAVKALLIDDIPILSRANFNEARRFVTLIDILYEARMRLFCSAAAQPDMLYLEGAGRFEFERTASRLWEMQSTGWFSGSC